MVIDLTALHIHGYTLDQNCDTEEGSVFYNKDDDPEDCYIMFTFVDNGATIDPVKYILEERFERCSRVKTVVWELHNGENSNFVSIYHCTNFK